MSVHIFTEPDSLSNLLRVDAKIYNFGTQNRLIGKDLAKALSVILFVAIGAFTTRDASTPRHGLNRLNSKH